ncbi:MAG: 6-phosphofructokinase, partial [Bacteroidota bacterium]
TILGHLQRGGAPTYFDRVLASRLGVSAVEGILAGISDVMIGIKDNEIVHVPFSEIDNKRHEIDQEALQLAKILSI